MADYQQNLLASLQGGLSFGQQIKKQRDTNQLNQLASLSYSAPMEQRNSLLGQMAAISPEAAQQQQKAFVSDEDRRNTTMVNMAKLLTSAPEQARPGLYQQMVPTLAKFGLSELPQQYDAQTAPIINQAAQSLVSAYSGLDKNTPTDVRSFQMMTHGLSPEQTEEARQIQLGLKGRASNAGYGFFEFEGADGRKRMGRNNPRTGAREVYDEASGNFTPLGGSSPAQAPQPPVPGFGIAETDNYVRNILSKVQVDPNATPEQQAAQLLPALIQQESAGNPAAVSNKGAVGLTQVMPATGADPGFGVSPLQNGSPEENVRFGRDYLTAMLRRYPGRPDLALAAYNAGPGVADRFAGSVAQNGAAQNLAVGRRAEDQAAAVEAAKTNVENQNFPNRLAQERQLQDVKTQGAITQAAGTATAEAQAKDAAQRPKRIQQYRQALTAAGNVEKSLDNALGLLSPYSTGYIGARSRGVEGSPSYNLAAELETIKANLGFDRLQQMRDSSPTGGALGAIAVQELVALQSTIANLDPNQSESQIRANIERVQTHYKSWRSAVEQSLAEEEQAQNAPAAPSPAPAAAPASSSYSNLWN